MGMNAQTQSRGLLSRLRASVKYLIYGGDGGGMWSGNPWGWSSGYGSDYRYGTTIDYRTRAGELTENAIVMACVRWIMINFAQPTRVMRTVQGNTKPEEQPAHPLLALLRNPNAYYSGELLMRATAFSLSIANNAYWLWWPNSAGVPVELWWEPHQTIRCVYPSDGDPNNDFIAYYEVWRNNAWVRVEKEYVIHFRDSLDPRNPRMGLWVLGAALREVFTDNEAAAYTATMLQNMGVAGMFVSPKGEGKISEPQELKRAIMAATQGDRRGEPMVFTGPVDVQIPAFTPEQMQVGKARDLPEERIAALLGPGLVIAAGLGAGLDRSTFHNVGEAIASAYRNNIMPTHRIVAGQINTQLMPLMGNPSAEYLEFDLTDVPELQEDRNQKAQRVTEAIKVGVPIYVNEARDALGYSPIEGMQDALVVPPPYILGMPLAEPAALAQPATPPTTPPPNGNGKGHSALTDTKVVVERNGVNWE